MPSVYRIGDVVLDAGRQELRRGEEPIRLGPLSYRLLLALTEAAPNVVSHDALANAVWDGRPVSPETISQRAKLLREALGDSAQEPRYIELRRGRGYRLIPPVVPAPTEEAASRSGTSSDGGSAAVASSPEATGRLGGRTIPSIIIGALSLLAIWLAFEDTSLSPAPPGTDHPPPVRQYTRLTTSQVVFPPYPSPYPLVADASRLYFSDWYRNNLGMAQLSRAGGEIVRIDSPFPDTDVQVLHGLSPDGTNILLTNFNARAAEPEYSLWLLPVIGGAPRLLGSGTDGAYSPDGTQILYTDGYDDVYLANADMTDARQLVRAPGKVHWTQFSPDGRRIRMLVYGITERAAIWEVSIEGGALRRVLPQWELIDHCCGRWTPDGKYYVFQATHDYRTQLWAVREADRDAGIEQSEPVRITTGALDFRRPTVVDGGRMIFAIGWQLRGEVVRYDRTDDEFVALPGFESASAEWLSYSPDGQRVAFVSFPEGELWRSNVDGSHRVKLTELPMKAANPGWSPDGRFLAFSGKLPDEHWQGYFVSSEGGTPRPVTPGDGPEETPTWSPDSRYLAFHGAGDERVQLLEIATGKTTEVAGTDGLAWPRWSPDGRHLAAYCGDALCLFDQGSKRRHVLVEGLQIGDFYWSRDSQHLYLIDPFYFAADRWVHRLDIRSKAIERVARIGVARSAWGVWAMWAGIAPDGAPLLLRDLSIHHIYALDWLP